MLKSTTRTRPSTIGAGRAAPSPRQATAAAPLVRESGRYSPLLLRQASRPLATSMVLSRTTAAAAQSTQAVAAGVRAAWACSTRLTIAAPIAATAAVSGRWASIHRRVAVGVCRGSRWPAKSKYVHQAPKPTTTETSATATSSTLTGSAASPLTTPVTVSPSTMMMSSPNRSMRASVTVNVAAAPDVAPRTTVPKPTR